MILVGRKPANPNVKNPDEAKSLVIVEVAIDLPENGGNAFSLNLPLSRASDNPILHRQHRKHLSDE